jgi:hypothetical protein
MNSEQLWNNKIEAIFLAQKSLLVVFYFYHIHYLSNRTLFLKVKYLSLYLKLSIILLHTNN